MPNKDNLILQFDDQSLSFGLGFQAGQIWTKMESREPFIEMFCGENLELIQRMACRKNYIFEIESLQHGWYKLTANPKE